MGCHEQHQEQKVFLVLLFSLHAIVVAEEAALEPKGQQKERHGHAMVEISMSRVGGIQLPILGSYELLY